MEHNEKSNNMKTQEAITQLKNLKELLLSENSLLLRLNITNHCQAIDKAIEELSRPSQGIDFICPYCSKSGCNGLDCDEYSQEMADVADKAFNVNSLETEFSNKFLHPQIAVAVLVLKNFGLKVLPLSHKYNEGQPQKQHHSEGLDDLLKNNMNITQEQLNEFATLNCSGIGVDGNIYKYVSKDKWVPEFDNVQSVFNQKIQIADYLIENDMTVCYGCGTKVHYPVHIEGHKYCSENCFNIGYTKSPLAKF